jgi:hypothetical protein
MPSQLLIVLVLFCGGVVVPTSSAAKAYYSSIEFCQMRQRKWHATGRLAVLSASGGTRRRKNFERCLAFPRKQFLFTALYWVTHT